MKKQLVKLKSFLIECRRVLKVTRKPTGTEFKTIVKASALGMAIIGLLGFVIAILRQLLLPPVAMVATRNYLKNIVRTTVIIWRAPGYLTQEMD